MKIREQARKDLAEVLLQAESLPMYSRRGYIVERMNSRGYSIPYESLLQTARDLGFPVIGNRIYGLDE